jgi:integrase
MARPATGQVVEIKGKRGRRYALRFTAYGKRRYVTTNATTEAEAQTELANVLADVRRERWTPPRKVEAPRPDLEEPTFHVFASEWLADREARGLSPKTIADYRWALEYHLLPFFANHLLSEITIREVDRYVAAKARQGVLSANSINKTLTRLSQILGLAHEYDPERIRQNAAGGKNRRLPTTTPARRVVEPEQLPSLLAVPADFYGGRGKTLLAVLAGAGLRIGEALALRRENVDLARGTLSVIDAKTAAGVRIVDLTPTVREALTLYLADSEWKKPTDLVFPTSSGKPDNRNNVRRRCVIKAVERANKRLAKLGIAPIGKLSPHGLRHTYASLRCACKDDPAYTAEQIGHTDGRFTMRVYTHAFKHRERLSEAERQEYDKALVWAQMGRSTPEAVTPSPLLETSTVDFPGEFVSGR